MLEHHGDAVGRTACTGLPWTSNLPSLSSVSPAMQRSSVVLPQPDGPTTHMISSRRICSDS